MLRSVGIAQGPFKQREFLAKMKVRKIKPAKYLLSDIYPMASGMQMVFLDPTTILFGEAPLSRAPSMCATTGPSRCRRTTLST